MGVQVPHKIYLKSRVAYEVVYVDRFDDPTVLALCRKDGTSRQILLRKDLVGEELISALLHEILHAIEFEYRIPIPHKLIYRLEKAILKVLKLNGWLPELKKEE